MNLHEHPTEPANSEETPQLSRRQLLKTLGLTALTALPASVVLPASAVAQTRQTHPSDDPRAILADSPLVRLVLDALAAQAFVVRDRRAAQVLAEQGGLVGLLLAPASPTARASAGLLVTVDRNQRDVSAVQLVQTWSLATSLEVQRTTLTHASMVPEQVQMRGGVVERPGPRDESYWSFPRELEAAIGRANPQLERGWPAAAADGEAWTAGDLDAHGWQTILGGPVLSTTQVSERHPQRGLRRLDLTRG
ncbi:MAG: hypothetical protein OHK0022_54560 [Roseiflexaceae bacterium]